MFFSLLRPPKVNSLLNVLLFSFFFFSCSFSFSCHHTLFAATVGINQLVLHPALDKTRQGLIDELTENPPKTSGPVRILVDSAQGHLVIASQIAQKFKGQGVDLIVALGTTAAQATRKIAKGTSIKVVFASVSDPLEAKLLKNLTNPEGHVTGTSNFTPLEAPLVLLREMIPDLKRLGILYNPGEANSVSLLKKMHTTAKRLKIQLVKATACKTSDVPQATRALLPKVQALLITNDNTALAAFEAIAKITTEARMPLFVSDTDMVDRGALAALGPDQYHLGRQTGCMVRCLLEGVPVNALPVEYPKRTSLVLNQKIAQKIGFRFQAQHLKKAVILN